MSKTSCRLRDFREILKNVSTKQNEISPFFKPAQTRYARPRAKQRARVSCAPRVDRPHRASFFLLSSFCFRLAFLFFLLSSFFFLLPSLFFLLPSSFWPGEVGWPSDPHASDRVLTERRFSVIRPRGGWVAELPALVRPRGGRMPIFVDPAWGWRGGRAKGGHPAARRPDADVRRSGFGVLGDRATCARPTARWQNTDFSHARRGVVIFPGAYARNVEGSIYDSWRHRPTPLDRGTEGYRKSQEEWRVFTNNFKKRVIFSNC